ncbi:MAG: hypothetical protein ACREMD_12395 [Gemmatimonadota bacterium]
MRTTTWMTVLTLMASILWGSACREGGGEEGLEIGGDTLRVEDEDLDATGREVRGAVEEAVEETGQAVGEAVEETGQAIEGAAEETGAAVDRAVEETGETIERAGREMQEDAGGGEADSL